MAGSGMPAATPIASDTEISTTNGCSRNLAIRTISATTASSA